MTIDWGYLTIIALYLIAAIAYSVRDGGDPWAAAFLVSAFILFGKAIAFCVGR